MISAAAGSGAALARAVEAMDTLRRRGEWESGQTHESLRPYLIEEAYELLDAIEAGDPSDIRDELGDVLLQVLFHARIAADSDVGRFTIDDVADALVAKLHRRSPLLTGAESVMDVEAQERAWQAAKAIEKPERSSCVDGIATGLPALVLAQKVLSRVRAAGLPAELIPESLRTIRLDADHDAEGRLRGDVRAFTQTVREAERSAKADGVVVFEMCPEDWLTHWPGATGALDPVGGTPR